MTINYQTQRVTVPQAFVTKGRQRVKQYNESVYLKNGDEFELELFNPTYNKVLAKINLNGKSLGSGIVLRPGERVFLERYFDEARKFLFETYSIDAKDSNALEAIKKNGLVEIQFYEESARNVYQGSTITYNNPSWSFTTTGGIAGYSAPTYTSGNSVKGMSSGVMSRSAEPQMDANIYQCSCNFSDSLAAPASPKLEETGRIEMGSNSNQDFVYDATSFSSWPSWTTTWKILPDSQKPIFREDLGVFCTKCGSKRKKSSHAFCPNCGNKF